MRVAIIDLGTNSVRFDIHQLGPGHSLRLLYREKLMVRLGQNVFLNGKLDPNAIHRTLHAFMSFQKKAMGLHVHKIVAFATSALREASDGTKLIDMIRSRTGIEVRVISGDDEARLIATGILNNEKVNKGRFALIDIGGGSTEISICRGRKVLHASSFPLGTARLQQVFLKRSPPKKKAKGHPDSVEQLRRYIRSTLLPKFVEEKWPEVTQIMGSSGTIRALAKIVKKTGGGKSVDRGELKKLVKTMSTMTTTQLLGVPGMEAKRVDMILAGAILFEECMLALGAKKAVTTNYSLRDGILDEQIDMFLQQKGSPLAFHLGDLYAKAIRLGADEERLKDVVEMTETLFDRLRNVHKLKPQWRIYLTAAAILKDTGAAIAPTNYAAHSSYIVKNANFPSMDSWESEFVAQLCLLQQSGKIDIKNQTFERDKTKRQALMKLLAILRIADALDGASHTKKLIKTLRIDKKQVRLTLSSKSASDLEVLRVDQRKGLFEQVFKRKLIAEIS